MKRMELNVEGMMCQGCEKRVQNVVGQIEGVEQVEASYEKKKVMILAKEEIDLADVKEKIEDIGYVVKD